MNQSLRFSRRQDLSDQIHFFVSLTDKLRAFTMIELLNPVMLK